MPLKIVAARLADISDQAIRNYSTYDFGRQKDFSNKSVVVDESVAQSILYETRQNLEDGIVAFIGTTRNLATSDSGKAEIVIALGKSQFDIIKIARSDGANYDLLSEDIISKLKQYDRDCGIDIFHAEVDTIEFILKSLPENITEFCQDIYNFCPDIVDQGVGLIEELEAAIMIREQVYLWWD